MAADSPKPTPTPVPFAFPGDRATAPMALEENSPSAWQRFEDLLSHQEMQFDRTKQLTQPPQGDAFAPTQPMDASALPGVSRDRQPQRPITQDEVMVLARRNNRACPRPQPWMAFHQLLPSRVQQGRTVDAPLPLIAGAWNAASPMQKRLRLRDQIEWAERAGALIAVYDFLLALPEEEWFHFDD
ncbi:MULTISPECIES: hypothetical protein [Ramlibacter]|uniref:Uncharacterized protein n=1 Tax=Ramlibacter pinisoli TaxID=2682844 RepID=A0A6N8IZY2_9BURK|nr:MULTISPECIES: hypothetical protein [Ramlibacter]MBA2961610.1 hypothetical protein [Ramlibacter sp. CGMCC 1.13660]MVQ31553.1 hypothetical protein [Ramlibacter pinisoli]